MRTQIINKEFNIRIYKELQELNKEGKDKPIEKSSPNINRHFTEASAQMVNKQG